MGRVPRVSIGVPVYNGEKFLPQALESLITQTYDDLEIIICDNASTDGTEAICRDFARLDGRVRYIRNPENLGAAGNFVRCLELARGEYFRWNSADDYSAPSLVEQCVRILDSRPDVVQVYSQTVLVDEEGQALGVYEDGLETLDESPARRYGEVMRSIGLVNGYYGLFRTALLRRTRVHGPFLGADVLVQEEVALYGKIVEVPEPLFFRRMHAEAHSAMSATQKAKFYDPYASGARNFYHWRHLRGRLGSMRRSPLGSLEKARLTGIILRAAIQNRNELWSEIRPSRRPNALAEATSAGTTAHTGATEG